MLALLAATLVSLGGCRSAEAPRAELVVQLRHELAGTPLRVGGEYRNAGGETYSVDKLRYYLSHLRLRATDGRWQSPRQSGSEGFHLVDAADAASQRLVLAGLPPGRYSGLEFVLGVEAAQSEAGAQGGALDAAHGLMWTWKSGYIFLLLEGRSPASRSAGQRLAYHVGGDDALLRTVFLPLPPDFALGTAAAGQLELHADLARVFDGPHAIRIAELSSAMEAAAGVPVADNAATMFSIGDPDRRLATAR